MRPGRTSVDPQIQHLSFHDEILAFMKNAFHPNPTGFQLPMFFGYPNLETQNEENCGARPRDWLSRIRSVVTVFFLNPVTKGRNFTRHG